MAIKEVIGARLTEVMRAPTVLSGRTISIGYLQHALLFLLKVIAVHKYLKSSRGLEKRFVGQCFIPELQKAAKVEPRFCHR